MFTIPTGCQLHNLRLTSLNRAWDNDEMMEVNSYTVNEDGVSMMLDDSYVVPDPHDPNPEWYLCKLCGDEFGDWEEAAEHINLYSE